MAELRTTVGVWTVEIHTLTHSNPKYIQGSFDSGTVTWIPDGIRFTTTAIDSIVDADGDLRDAAIYATREMKRRDDRLVVHGTYQFFDFAKAGDGSVLTTPDFAASR